MTYQPRSNNNCECVFKLFMYGAIQIHNFGSNLNSKYAIDSQKSVTVHCLIYFHIGQVEFLTYYRGTLMRFAKMKKIQK